MRASVFLFIVAAFALSGCGGTEKTPPEPPPVKAELEQEYDDAMKEFEAVIAATPPPARPGFKIAPTNAAGLDLWSQIVAPMGGELSDLDGTPELRKKLTRAQYAVYVLFSVDYEIGNGGIAQLYYNPTGMWAKEIPGLLRQVGAAKHAAIVEQANAEVAPDGPVPSDRDARNDALNRADGAHLAALEDDYYDLEALEDVVERYIRAHPRDFFG